MKLIRINDVAFPDLICMTINSPPPPTTSYPSYLAFPGDLHLPVINLSASPPLFWTSLLLMSQADDRKPSITTDAGVQASVFDTGRCSSGCANHQCSRLLMMKLLFFTFVLLSDFTGREKQRSLENSNQGRLRMRGKARASVNIDMEMSKCVCALVCANVSLRIYVCACANIYREKSEWSTCRRAHLCVWERECTWVMSESMNLLMWADQLMSVLLLY